jgi:chromosomal replication initiation ATPase DnaA
MTAPAHDYRAPVDRQAFVRGLKRLGAPHHAIHAAVGALDAAVTAARQRGAQEAWIGTPYHRLVAAVCAACQTTPRALRGPQRARRTARPRQIVMYLATTDLGLATTTVGRLLGGRDHSTIIHGRDTIARMIETDSAMRERVECIRAGMAQEG